jgi:hypothetical protein
VLEDLGRREVPVLLAAALHLLILLDPVEDLPQVAWVVGARNGSFLGRIPVRATIFFTVTTAPLSTGQYPSQGTPLGSSWNLEFLNLTWHGPFLSRIPAGIPDS